MDEPLTIKYKEKEKGRQGGRGKQSLPSSFLPAFDIPFVVKPNYQIRSDLVKMPVELFGQHHDKHFVFDEQYFKYVAAKLEQVENHPELSHVYTQDYDETALTECAKIIFKKLADEHPNYVSVKDDGVTLRLLGLHLGLETFGLQKMEVDGIAASFANDVYTYLQKQQGVKKLWDTLALAVQEDLVIVKDDGEMGVSELMHVCLPSHWNPGERVGQSLVGLHQPVANNEQLLKASKNTLQAMVNKGPFVRFVWSLNSTDELNLNPAFHTHGRKKPLGDDPSQWFFRVERQTTLPIPELKRSLFTIRILVAPLPSVLNDERRNLLAQAVLSMDEKLLGYKGLVKQKDMLLEYLRGRGVSQT